MKYLLDTNACIAILNGTSAAVIRRFAAQSASTVGICAIVRAELEFGARNSDRTASVLANVERFVAPLTSLAFDDVAAQHYGTIRADLRRAGTPIGANDLLIAAIARSRDVTVATNNVAEFRRVVGLRVEDWSIA